MSDLETPEADMIRDHSSLDAAPATLQLEESRPSLDPNNPGAAPDTTLDHVAWEGAVVSTPPCRLRCDIAPDRNLERNDGQKIAGQKNSEPVVADQSTREAN